MSLILLGTAASDLLPTKPQIAKAAAMIETCLKREQGSGPPHKTWLQLPGELGTERCAALKDMQKRCSPVAKRNANSSTTRGNRARGNAAPCTAWTIARRAIELRDILSGPNFAPQ